MNAQGIEKAEEEGAKRRVEAQAARKQADKLRKEVAKATQEKQMNEAALEKLTAEFQVRFESVPNASDNGNGNGM